MAIIKYAEDLFLNHKLFFQTPAELNDPFDCKVDGLIFDISEEEFAIIIEGVIRRSIPGIPFCPLSVSFLFSRWGILILKFLSTINYL